MNADNGWTIHHWGDKDIDILTPDGDEVCAIRAFAHKDTGMPILTDEQKDIIKAMDIGEARAKVIAAAPDLLAALRLAIEFTFDGTPDADVSPVEHHFRHAAIAAIEKATGLPGGGDQALRDYLRDTASYGYSED